ncbi:MAG: hypothetical protein PHV85_09420 [Desulfovibrionaceae bacterium]|nr:hypothetical protein [Desulfovibrionaceae bacterium]
MPEEFSFSICLGSRLSDQDLGRAAQLLSAAYTRWQEDPRNTDPVRTDTSALVYERMMRKGLREVVLYYEQGRMCGVFVHSLSPQFDQYPLRKLSYICCSPLERGFGPLKTAFARYAGFVAEQGEDVVVTTDLDQSTLNALLEAAGFAECVDRNETYYLLGQLLFRKLITSQRVAGDFVVDEIIRCDGRTLRRNKKLYKLQTTPFDFYAMYRRQQQKRLERSVPEQNRGLLAESLAHFQDGLFFISGFGGALTLRNPAKGGFDLWRAVRGEDPIGPGFADPDLVFLLPDSEQALREVAEKTVLRPGFFDFLSYGAKILGSFFVLTGHLSQEVLAVLERSLHPDVGLRYLDLIERVLCPGAEPAPEIDMPGPDGRRRTAWRLSGPYAAGPDRDWPARARDMVREVLALRGANRAPVVFLGNDIRDAWFLRALRRESGALGAPILVFDFGQDLSALVRDELLGGRPGDDPGLSVVNVSDFYQLPVMLEGLGLAPEMGVDLFLS